MNKTVKHAPRTDLALEFNKKPSRVEINSHLSRSELVVDKAYFKKTGRAEGVYISLESDLVTTGGRGEYSGLSREIANSLKNLTAGARRIMCVGLGNPNLTADALGKAVIDRLIITRGIFEETAAVQTCCVCPSVLGVTGIESFDIVKGAAERVKPDAVIIIDSLAAAAVKRIASVFQISDAGITPGSGVSNHRVRFDKSSLGVKVVSVGVPLVVYASTLIKDAAQKKADETEFDRQILDMIVTPKDVDLYVEECASVIASGINEAFFGLGFSAPSPFLQV